MTDETARSHTRRTFRKESALGTAVVVEMLAGFPREVPRLQDKRSARSSFFVKTRGEEPHRLERRLDQDQKIGATLVAHDGLRAVARFRLGKGQ